MPISDDVDPPLMFDPDEPPRAPHLQPSLLLLVAIGGCVGAPARYAIGVWGAGVSQVWPWSTFVINVSGALALGILLESLARSGPDTGTRRRIRLLFGTGFLGTFTTYSSLAVETDLLIRGDRLDVAVGYALASVAAGLVAVVVGVLLAGTVGRSRRRPSETSS